MTSEPMLYCAQCRAIHLLATSESPVCPTCPNEPLIDVSEPAQRQMIEELEETTRDRAQYRWMVGLGVPLGLVGFAVGCPTAVAFELGGQLALAPAGLLTIGGVALGRTIARRLWRRNKRSAGVADAIAQHRQAASRT